MSKKIFFHTECIRTLYADKADGTCVAIKEGGEVVEVGLDLAKEFGLDEKYIVKKPSDGLTGMSDEDNFGFTYAELDHFINGVLPESAEVGKKIIAMHTATEHKRCLPCCFRKE